MKKRISNIYQFLKQVITEFSNDNVLKYSASLSYYTIFSLAPTLIIILSVCGFLLGKEAMQGEIYGQISGLVGSEAALQIQTTIKSTHLSKTTTFATIVSVISLILGATGVFGEIQDSLNRIWGLKVKPRSGIWKVVINRLLSFSLILSLGFVLIVSLILNAVILSIGNRLDHYLSGFSTSLIPLIEIIVSLVVNTILFAAIFKILPDAKIKWKDVTVGAFITSVLFMLGRFLISYYLAAGKLTTVYGAAGSIIIILLWTYYSSAILYLGAEFTKVYAIKYGNKILPNDYSTWIKTEEVPVSAVDVKAT